MSTGEILALGAIAGFTVFLGLPMGRVRSAAPRVRSFLNASATGILLFLLWDVLSEGLAIGQSAAAGELRLALVLVIGFALHNATEGFGIVGPMSGEADLPSWRFLGALGLIAGGPTFVGTVIGQTFHNETVFAAFLALAAGSILYVVIELLAVARKLGHKDFTTWGILLGLILGFATDMILPPVGDSRANT